MVSRLVLQLKKLYLLKFEIKKTQASLARNGIHQPPQRHRYQHKHGEGPCSVLEAFERIAAAERAKRQRNDHRKKQQRLKVRQMQRHHSYHALRRRAAS